MPHNCPQHGLYNAKYCPGCYPQPGAMDNEFSGKINEFISKTQEAKVEDDDELYEAEVPKLPTHFACVTWLDAFSVDGQYNLEDVEVEVGVLIHSAGILLHETDLVVCLARCYCPDESYQKYVRNLIRIPRCNVLSIAKYPLPEV